jgi:hypothetical protein
MKILKIIIVTFILAFATSALFELKFIDANRVRYSLVILLILIELATGFFYIKSEVTKPKNN